MCSKELEDIRQDIEKSMNTRLGKDFKNIIDKITTQIFTEKSHFIMEITQNAEDAIGQKQIDDGKIIFYLSSERIKIEHNGLPFDNKDVDSICGVRSNKDPAENYIGYMGIGFKSVFSITNKAQIFSGNYKFKFDKVECHPELPWFIYPLETKPSERLNDEMTTLIFPFKTRGDTYQKTKDELEKFGMHLLIFLNWIKNIEIHFEEEGQTKKVILEKFPTKDGIMRISEGRIIKEFKIFSKELDVPPEISEDPDTIKSNRDKIKKRLVIIAFPLGENRELERWEQKDKSVYSFLPLENARSGYPFIIQADFIVEPGRRNIDYNPAWNHWLIKEIEKLVEDAILYFQEDKNWRKNYLTLFKVESRSDDKVFENLFKPNLIDPLKEFLDEPKVPDIENNLIPINKAVKASPHGEIIDLFNKDDLNIYYNDEGLAFMDPDVQIREEENEKIKELNLLNVAKNKEFLINKLDDISWFKKLYQKLNSQYSESHDLDGIYILTEDNELKKAGQLFFNELPKEIEDLRKESEDVQIMLKQYPFLNSQLEIEFKEFFDVNKLVKKVNYKSLCEEVFLPTVSTESDKPKKADFDKIVNYTMFIKSAKLTDKPIWVVSKTEDIISSEDVLLSSEYSSDETWDEHKEHLPFEFINECYLKHGDQKEWYDFFKELGVKTKDDYPQLTIKRLLPSIRPMVGGEIRSPPHKNKLILITRLIKEYYGHSEQSGDIWAITKSGELLPSDKGIFFGSIYSPKRDWEKNSHYLKDIQGIDIRFLSEDYIQDKTSKKEIDEWRDFFLKFKIKEEGSETLIGKFGERFTEMTLNDNFTTLKNVSVEDRGYDLKGEKSDGKIIYIEVKGRTKRTEEIKDNEIELTENESKAAGTYKDDFWVSIVTNIPEDPRMYLIHNPSEKGTKLKIAISKDTWSAFDKQIKL